MNLRDTIHRYLPSWLADNHPESPSYGFRFLWGCALLVDGALEVVLQATLAAVGRGTPTALPYVGHARGLVRYQDESHAAFAARLPTWIDRAKERGSPRHLAREIHRYLRSHPRVRIFNRWGWCLTIERDGTESETEDSGWDWDSVSHPERSDPDDPWWSDLWIVVYTRAEPGDPIDQWAPRPGTLGDITGDDGFALGHLASAEEVDVLKGIIQSKPAHECVRAVIWTSDPERFDPSEPASMPNGRWGSWGIYDAVAGQYVPSDRDTVTCRFWEPR
ncbi:MAG: hypothetical protein KF764_08620 [Labilithrix sp.]|nr:hypothetical protein [Labilithrix sp.]